MFLFFSPNRGAKAWYPDGKYFKQQHAPILYPGEVVPIIPYIPPSKYPGPPIEKKVKNMVLNFGPQHPAAHGVLRLILELDHEVGIKISGP